MKNLFWRILPLFILFNPMGNAQINKDGNLISKENIAPKDFKSGIIPSESRINDLMFNQSTSWEEMDTYYKNEVLMDQEVHYFINLQVQTIIWMVMYTNYEKAPEATMRYYISEMLSRKYINSPEAFERMLELASPFLSQEEMTMAAQKALIINESFLSKNEEARVRHYDIYRESYSKLEKRAFN